MTDVLRVAEGDCGNELLEVVASFVLLRIAGELSEVDCDNGGRAATRLNVGSERGHPGWVATCACGSTGTQPVTATLSHEKP